MPTRKVDNVRPSAVPAELGGKWVAWNAEHTCIVAHAETLQQLWQVTQETRLDDPIFEKVPLADVRFVGAR
jgi:carotenoid cleavage dioxygenase-like enzyme